MKKVFVLIGLFLLSSLTAQAQSLSSQFLSDREYNKFVEDASGNVAVRAVISAANSPTDEYCLTYEETGSTTEWQTCSGGGSTAYDAIGDPDDNSTIAFGGFVNSWTTNETASDFFNITNSGNFGDVSLMVLQSTGNPTDGTMFEIINTDTNVDSIVAPNFSLTQAGVLGASSVSLTGGSNERVTGTTNGEYLDFETDGIPCLNGAGATNNEDFCFDLESTANTVGITSNTSVDKINFGAMALYTSGNVGVGLSAPTAPLQVQSSASSGLVTQATLGQTVSGSNYTDITTAASLDFRLPTNSGAALASRIEAGKDVADWTASANRDGNLEFYTATNFSGLTSKMIIKSSGNVGIGNTAPTEKLHVTGGARVTGLVSCDTIDTDSNGVLSCGTDDSSGSPTYNTIGDPDDNSTIAFGGFVNSWTTNETASDFFNITNSGNFGDVSLMVLQETGNATDGTMLEIVSTDTDVDKLVINGTQLVVRGSGNVGIGTSAPTYNLDVVGDIGIDSAIYHNDDGGVDTMLRFPSDNRAQLYGKFSGIDVRGDLTPPRVDVITANFKFSGDSDTIADSGDGNPATHSLTPSGSLVLLTCSDTDGCTVTLDDTTSALVANGITVHIVNVSTNVCTFADTSGVTELNGAFNMGQWDMLELMYVTDRWVEQSRSDN